MFIVSARLAADGQMTAPLDPLWAYIFSVNQMLMVDADFTVSKPLSAGVHTGLIAIASNAGFAAHFRVPIVSGIYR
jgi:hypothetical protein